MNKNKSYLCNGYTPLAIDNRELNHITNFKKLMNEAGKH